MEYYPEYSENDFRLYHHGILGMKWGQRNGPPYPLSGSAHSSSEKKAGWRKSLDGNSDEKKAKRARSSANVVHTVVDSYSNAMDKKASKLKEEAIANPTPYNLSNAAETSKAAAKIKSVSKALTSNIDLQNQVKTQEEREKQQKAVSKDVRKNWYKTHNVAATDFNSKIGAINKKYEGTGGVNNPKYMKEVSDLWKSCYDDAIKTRYGDTEIDRSMFPTYYTYDNM